MLYLEPVHFYCAFNITLPEVQGCSYVVLSPVFWVEVLPKNTIIGLLINRHADCECLHEAIRDDFN